MMRKLRYVLVILVLPLFMGCGNSGKITDPPTEISDNDNTEEVGGVTIGAVTKTEPPVKDDLEETAGDVFVDGDATEIEWLDFETAIDRNKEEKKFIFIDMYTEWCGWCKKMDASTFKDPSVINYIDQNFYAVKMNPESKEAIAYKEVLYESKQYGKKMYNELGVNLLAGQMSFPSFVVLNKREVKRGVITGYQTQVQLLVALKKYLD
jgi:thioredoxin-related protein